ncbi:hypothetical protein OOK31_25650 [Streptomyces sp. NBC_00249]|uniref:hypothetical protein n=1 Tax=Streptomyces sp. NBC_00249 TaxID=2975690 RepID=UPI002255B5FC|nr:hypothetical protein [Streptomyces sp. NBC_00249]MCX5197243.1 hypothetical protein [Streptomyces sp. NBC_00249]
MPDSEQTPLAAQRVRRDTASRTLAASRIADLAALDPAAAILMIESLRSSLDDTLQLLGEHIDPC